MNNENNGNDHSNKNENNGILGKRKREDLEPQWLTEHPFEVQKIENDVKRKKVEVKNVHVVPAVQDKELLSLVDAIQELDVLRLFWRPMDEQSDVFKQNPELKQMDISTLRSNIKRQYYQTFHQFWEDVEMMFSNAKIYFNDNAKFYSESVKVQDLSLEEAGRFYNSSSIEYFIKPNQIKLKLTTDEEKFMKILERLKGSDNRQYFFESKLENNYEYKQRIKDPLDYEKLTNRVVQGKYLSPEEFKNDLIGMYLNGKIFFHTNTHGYRFSKNMIDKADKLMYQEFQLPTQAMRVDDRKQQHKDQKSKLFVPEITRWDEFPSDVLESSELKQLMKLSLKRLIDEDEWEVFIAPVSRTQYPEYYEIIGKPMDFETIGHKIDEGTVLNWGDFEELVEVTLANCRHYNDKDSVYYRQAIRMQRVLRRIRSYILKKISKKDYKSIEELVEQKKVDDLEKKILDNYQAVDVKKRRFQIPGYLYKTMKITVDLFLRYDRNRLFSFPIDTEVVQDYLDIVETPMDLTTIKNNVKSKKYDFYSQFKKDLLLVYENSMKYNEKGSKFYEEAEAMYCIAEKKCQQDTENVNFNDSLPIHPKDMKDDDENSGKTRRGRSTRNSELAATEPDYFKSHTIEQSDEENEDDVSKGMYRHVLRSKKEKIKLRRFDYKLGPISSTEMQTLSKMSMQELLEKMYPNSSVDIKSFLANLKNESEDSESSVISQNDNMSSFTLQAKTEEDKKIIESIQLDMQNQRDLLAQGYDIFDNPNEDVQDESILSEDSEEEKEEDREWNPNTETVEPKKRGRRPAVVQPSDDYVPDAVEPDEDYVPSAAEEKDVDPDAEWIPDE